VLHFLALWRSQRRSIILGSSEQWCLGMPASALQSSPALPASLLGVLTPLMNRPLLSCELCKVSWKCGAPRYPGTAVRLAARPEGLRNNPSGPNGQRRCNASSSLQSLRWDYPRHIMRARRLSTKYPTSTLDPALPRQFGLPRQGSRCRQPYSPPQD